MLAIFFLWLGFQKETILKNEGAFIELSAYFLTCRVLEDGSYVVWEPNRFYHFYKDGSLHFKTGKKGSRPGEFEYIESVVFYQGCFIVADAGKQVMCVYDKDGNYLRRNSLGLYNLKVVEDSLYGGDSFLIPKVKELGPDSKVRFQARARLNADFKVYLTGEYFMEPEDVCYEWSFLSCVYHVEQIGEYLYVSSYMSNKVRKISLEDFGVVDEFELSIDGYVPPQRGLKKGSLRTIDGVNKVMNAFTQIMSVYSMKDYLVVHYIVPTYLTEKPGKRYVQKFDLNGHALSKPVEVDGQFMGVYENEVLVLKQYRLEGGDYEQKVVAIDL